MYAILLTTLVLALSPASSPVRAQDDFYRNKQIRLIVGHPVGNDHDVGGRLLAKYLSKYVPGQPTVVVQNMTAAASVAAANYVYAQAPRDGTVIGTFSRNFPSQARMGQSNIEADPQRMQWLGATSFPARVCTAWHATSVKTAADLLTHELIVGGSGAASTLSIVPTVINHVLGTKFRIIEGYKAAQNALLAIERGELEGVCSSYSQFRSFDRLFRENKLRILFRVEEAPIADLPDLPSIFELAKADEQRQLMRFIFSSVEFGRPYVFPPGVPPERVTILRKAIADAVRDPDLIAEAPRMKLDMAYRTPEHLERLVAQLYATPAETIETVKKLVPSLD
jgi:tripartite-type tricarboxylate transporter receptor subunit TctC